MYSRKKSVFLVLVMVLTVFLVRTPTPTHAQFVIADWDYPDEYGQGILRFVFYENSTGSWLLVGDSYQHNDTHAVQWNASIFIKIRCVTRLNATLTQAPTAQAGRPYLRHTVSVTNLGESVFSQQNFVFVSGAPEAFGMYIYGYEAVLDFLPIAGQIYVVVVNYEIFY